jgi:CubicO group peptidase (beta-lactamase class C family)
VVATLAFRGATVFSHGAGETTKGSGTAPTADTVYRIGSVSKVFAVAQLYLLADAGALSLDDTLADHANKVSFVNPFVAGTTAGAQGQPSLRQLASQRAGLAREPPCFFGCNLTNAEMVTRISGRSILIAPPGETTVPSYSNMAFALLGRELAPDVGWEQWTQKHLLDPLGLNARPFKNVRIPNTPAQR